MSTFSELLSARIKQSDLTLPYLAAKSGVSLSLITKTKNGTRLPDEDTMNHLFTALRRSADQTDELVEQYHIEKLGRYEYECDMECFRTLENLGLSEKKMTKTFSLSGTYEFNYQPAVSSMQDIRLFMLYMYNKCREDGDTLKVIYPVSDTFFNDLIATASQIDIEKNVCVKTEHVFRMYPAGRPKATYKNLEIVSGALYMLSLNQGYIPYYYYNEDSEKQIYPYLIMNSSYAMLINSEMNSGILLNDARMVESCGNEFDSRRKASTSLVKQFFALDDYITEVLEGFKNNKTKEVFCLSDFPCVLPCISNDTIMEHVIPEIRNMPEIGEYLNGRMVILSYDIVNICSIEGIRHFIETGIVEEVPNGIHEPLSRTECIGIMQNYLQSLDGGRVRLHLIRNPHIRFTDNFEICSFNDEKTIIMWKYGKLSQQFDFFNEISVAEAFRNFIEFFVNSSMVYSEKESRKILEDMLKKYEQQQSEQ